MPALMAKPQAATATMTARPGRRTSLTQPESSAPRNAPAAGAAVGRPTAADSRDRVGAARYPGGRAAAAAASPVPALRRPRRPPNRLPAGGRPKAGLLVALAAGKRRLGGREPGDRNPERRAGDVVETQAVTGRDRGGIAAMLAADAHLQVRAGGPAL